MLMRPETAREAELITNNVERIIFFCRLYKLQNEKMSHLIQSIKIPHGLIDSRVKVNNNKNCTMFLTKNANSTQYKCLQTKGKKLFTS